MINRVTITGADNSIKPFKLVKLWLEFPFVEWGILVSQNNFGAYRFPTENWLKELREVKADYPNMPLSMHLCGSYVRNLVKEGQPYLSEMGLVFDMWSLFERVQLNFHAIPHDHSDGIIQFINDMNTSQKKEFIFQYDGVNDGILRKAAAAGCNVSALFDKSGGAGILPAEWPELLSGIKCGYAGGLSPLNLDEQITLIEKKAGFAEIWIDTETHVRSADDSDFDLAKVRHFLRTAGARKEVNTQRFEGL